MSTTVVCSYCLEHLKGPWPPRDRSYVSDGLCRRHVSVQGHATEALVLAARALRACWVAAAACPPVAGVDAAEEELRGAVETLTAHVEAAVSLEAVRHAWAQDLAERSMRGDVT